MLFKLKVSSENQFHLQHTQFYLRVPTRWWKLFHFNRLHLDKSYIFSRTLETWSTCVPDLKLAVSTDFECEACLWRTAPTKNWPRRAKHPKMGRFSLFMPSKIRLRRHFGRWTPSRQSDGSERRFFRIRLANRLIILYRDGIKDYIKSG